jgi:putative ABC transport system permease protein
MKWWQQLLVRFRSIFRKAELDSEMDEEMHSHVEMQTQENIDSGMKPEEARYAAVRQFGWAESIKERCFQQRGMLWLRDLVQDVCFGARMLLKNPGYTALAVFTLALGIGATSAVFSLIQGVLLTPPLYPKPERIVVITLKRIDGRPSFPGCTAAQWLEWRNQAKSFEALAGYYVGHQFLILSNGSQFLQCMPVVPEYFNVIGIKPLLGRTFLPSDTPRPETPASVTLLSYGVWQRCFHGDADIVGKTVLLSRFPPLTVVGVMPPGIRFLPAPTDAAAPNYDLDAMVDYWAPAALAAESKEPNWNVVGRLRTGVTVKQAQAELSAIAARQARASPDFKDITAKVQPLTSELNRTGERLLLPLSGGVFLVLLIACGNFCGLLLVRGLQRQQEYAVRSSLGAPRARLFRQVLTESLLTAFLGSAVGIGAAAGIVSLLKAIGGVAIPRLDVVTVGWPVLFFCFGSSVLAALLAGILPALNASHLNGAEALGGKRTSSAGKRERHLLRSIAIFQTAFTLMLLTGATLLIRTASNLAKVYPGFKTRNVLTMNVTDVHEENFYDFHGRALDRVVALPGVKTAAFVWGTPLTGNKWFNTVEIEGQPDNLIIPTRSVTPEYFDLLDQKIVVGRKFPTDRVIPADGRVRPDMAIINEAMKDKYFPSMNPVGKKIRVVFGGQPGSVDIIGVVTDARTVSLMKLAEPEIYFSLWQAFPFTKSLIVKTTTEPRLMSGLIERELRAIDPTVAVEHIKTMEEIRADSVASQTFAMRLLIGFSLMGSVLALVGIYAVISLSVDSQRREIAIRMALGAQRKTLLCQVLNQGLKLIVFGLALGLIGAIALSRGLRTFLFGVSPTDPITFICVAVLFAAVALLACLLPSVRATRTDPMTALRCE